MSFATNLSRARSHLIIVFGLITASALILSIENRTPGRIADTAVAARPLTQAEKRAAAYAWSRIPPEQRTDSMKAKAAKLGLGTDQPGAIGPQEAIATFEALAAAGARP